MSIAFLIGRIIFGAYWIRVAYNHIFGASHMIGYAASKNVPAPKVAIIGSGILALLGGLSILLGSWTTTGIILLVVFLVGVTFKMHDFWNDQDAMAKMGNSVNFMKNVALIGALLMMLAISQPWAYHWPM